ncbi:MAG TPA: transketolase C-terminal domain-containing protein [Thermoplasmata archaeon]|nr:transketolase C-terminal domain-containing protein [Thermoplasmata archaeon]
MAADVDRPGTVLKELGLALGVLGERVPTLRVVDLHPAESEFAQDFRSRFPERWSRPSGATSPAVEAAGEAASDGVPVIVCGPAERVAIEGFPAFRKSSAHGRRWLKLVTTDGGWSGTEPPVLEDLALVQGVPGAVVVVPSDLPSAMTALDAVVRREGPAYLRLDPDLVRESTGPPFELGRARELADGRDLAITAVGPAVALALRGATELHRVGVSARVLDCASLAPLDEKAILRAARDTGAILSLESHQATTGLGRTIAALTAENHPVPVRRLGAPGLFGTAGEAGGGLAGLGLTPEAVLEEAWELLRLKGKVQ